MKTFLFIFLSFLFLNSCLKEKSGGVAKTQEMAPTKYEIIINQPLAPPKKTEAPKPAENPKDNSEEILKKMSSFQEMLLKEIKEDRQSFREFVEKQSKPSAEAIKKPEEITNTESPVCTLKELEDAAYIDLLFYLHSFLKSKTEKSENEKNYEVRLKKDSLVYYKDIQARYPENKNCLFTYKDNKTTLNHHSMAKKNSEEIGQITEEEKNNDLWKECFLANGPTLNSSYNCSRYCSNTSTEINFLYDLLQKDCNIPVQISTVSYEKITCAPEILNVFITGNNSEITNFIKSYPEKYAKLCRIHNAYFKPKSQITLESSNPSPVPILVPLPIKEIEANPAAPNTTVIQTTNPQITPTPTVVANPSTTTTANPSTTTTAKPLNSTSTFQSTTSTISSNLQNTAPTAITPSTTTPQPTTAPLKPNTTQFVQ